jgi:hypothetical protein
MNTHYTPGPWRILDSHIPEAEKHIIGWIEEWGESVTVAIASSDAPQLTANARLISKAPEMEELLDATEQFLETLNSVIDGDLESLEYQLYRRISFLREDIHEGK